MRYIITHTICLAINNTINSLKTKLLVSFYNKGHMMEWIILIFHMILSVCQNNRKVIRWIRTKIKGLLMLKISN